MAKLQSRELEEDEEEERSFEETGSQSKDQDVAVYGVVSKLYTQYILMYTYLAAWSSRWTLVEALSRPLLLAKAHHLRSRLDC
jgi:hypothetical protein